MFYRIFGRFHRCNHNSRTLTKFYLLSLCSLFIISLSTSIFASDNKNTATTTEKSNPAGGAATSATNTMGSDAGQNLTNSQKFLADNKKQAGVNTLPSGLQYKVIQEGKGNPPGPTDFVTVHYRGKLINGTEFDSSYSRNEPAVFAVNAVIPGWTEALQLMKPGSKWTIFVPPNLAYGNRGAGNKIPPNAALIFDIELLSVKHLSKEEMVDDVEDWDETDRG